MMEGAKARFLYICLLLLCAGPLLIKRACFALDSQTFLRPSQSQPLMDSPQDYRVDEEEQQQLYEKRAPGSFNFYGMRGKKAPAFSFYGMRGKKGESGAIRVDAGPEDLPIISRGGGGGGKSPGGMKMVLENALPTVILVKGVVDDEEKGPRMVPNWW